MADGDFEPIGEGSVDINEPITDDELAELIPREGDEDSKTWRDKVQDFFKKRGIKTTVRQRKKLFKNPSESNKNWYSRVREEFEMDDLDKTREELRKRERNITTAKNRIKKLFPTWDDKSSPFLFDLDGYNNVVLRLKKGTKTYYLDNYEKLPMTIKESLGKSKNKIIIYNEIKDKINTNFPENKFDDNFDFKYNDGRMQIKHDTSDKWSYLYNKDDTINKNLPGIISNKLGETAKTILNRNDDSIKDVDKHLAPLYPEIVVLNKQIDSDNLSIRSNQSSIQELHDSIDDAERIAQNPMTSDEERHINVLKQQKETLIQENNELFDSREAQTIMKDRLDAKIKELELKKQELENKNELIDEKLPLKERVKRIFKKYGFTATAIITSVGVIIGVIVSSLKSGLSSVATGVGNGLKSLGKKLGDILPGMVGAIASFIFRTAGQVVGFLAKHAWLLIVGLVLYVVERYKNKK